MGCGGRWFGSHWYVLSMLVLLLGVEVFGGSAGRGDGVSVGVAHDTGNEAAVCLRRRKLGGVCVCVVYRFVGRLGEGWSGYCCKRKILGIESSA